MKSLDTFEKLIANMTSALKSTPVNAVSASNAEKAVHVLNEPANLVIFGTFSSGKSSILNTLLNIDYLKISDTPTTAKITRIVYGETEKLEAVFKGGMRKTYPLEKLEELSSEVTMGKELRGQLEYVQLTMPHELLKKVTLIDTPGFDSTNESHTSATESIFSSADVAYWVFDVDQTATNSEKNKVREVEKHVKPIGIINKIDDLEESDELQEIIEYATASLSPLINEFIGVSAELANKAIVQGDEKVLGKSNWNQFLKSIELQTSSEKILNRKSFRIVSLVRETLKTVNDALDRDLQAYREKLNNVTDIETYREEFKLQIEKGRRRMEEWNRLSKETEFYLFKRASWPFIGEADDPLRDAWEQQIYYFEELLEKEELLKMENGNLMEEERLISSRIEKLKQDWKEYNSSGVFGNEPILFTGRKTVLTRLEQELDEDIQQYNYKISSFENRLKILEELKTTAIQEFQRYAVDVVQELKGIVEEAVAEYNNKDYLQHAKDIIQNCEWIPASSIRVKEDILPLLVTLRQESDSSEEETGGALDECITLAEQIANNALSPEEYNDAIHLIEKKMKAKELKAAAGKSSSHLSRAKRRKRSMFSFRWLKPVLTASLAMLLIYAFVSNMDTLKAMAGRFIEDPQATITVDNDEWQKYDVYVQTDGANIRNRPSLSSDILTAVSKGKRLTVLDAEVDEDGREWLYVIVDENRKGWVSGKTVSAR